MSTLAAPRQQLVLLAQLARSISTTAALLQLLAPLAPLALTTQTLAAPH